MEKTQWLHYYVALGSLPSTLCQLGSPGPGTPATHHVVEPRDTKFTNTDKIYHAAHIQCIQQDIYHAARLHIYIIYISIYIYIYTNIFFVLQYICRRDLL